MPHKRRSSGRTAWRSSTLLALPPIFRRSAFGRLSKATPFQAWQYNGCFEAATTRLWSRRVPPATHPSRGPNISPPQGWPHGQRPSTRPRWGRGFDWGRCPQPPSSYNHPVRRCLRRKDPGPENRPVDGVHLRRPSGLPALMSSSNASRRRSNSARCASDNGTSAGCWLRRSQISSSSWSCSSGERSSRLIAGWAMGLFSLTPEGVAR